MHDCGQMPVPWHQRIGRCFVSVFSLLLSRITVTCKYDSIALPLPSFDEILLGLAYSPSKLLLLLDVECSNLRPVESAVT